MAKWTINIQFDNNKLQEDVNDMLEVILEDSPTLSYDEVFEIIYTAIYDNLNEYMEVTYPNI